MFFITFTSSARTWEVLPSLSYLLDKSWCRGHIYQVWFSGSSEEGFSTFCDHGLHCSDELMRRTTNRCRTFSPPVRAFLFIAHRVQHSHYSSIFINVMLLTHALALSANQFLSKTLSLRVRTLGEN